uniref:Uncharacterized protein n=1 Tax=Candidatus Kentrum sp. TUN TaxID=2126343 RepID=A0A450ZAC4_9GAMM|nr:MAG: hypothetical protein BECKTUN1418E_GA0071001_100423 [Candidatus Kentron sp. TUN]VFK51965.1 MAG: hypothetical protein BECKTUN1418F_GA0071002_100423 [Candidatus Kentron sp. TUN]
MLALRVKTNRRCFWATGFPCFVFLIRLWFGIDSVRLDIQGVQYNGTFPQISQCL